MKHTSIELKHANSIVAPFTGGFVRLISRGNNALYTIDENGKIEHISKKWDLPVSSMSYSDPNQLTVIHDWSRFIVPDSATGDWAGQDGKIAQYNGTEWEFYNPDIGTTVYVYDQSHIYFYDGNAWVKIPTLDDVFPETDKLTIDSFPGFYQMTSGDDFIADIERFWIYGEYRGVYTADEYIYGNGKLYAGPGANNVWHHIASQGDPWPGGRYEFYSTYNLQADGQICIEDEYSNVYYFTATYENGLWRHSVVLPDGHRWYGVYFSATHHNPAVIWLINRFERKRENTLKIANIDRIIGGDKLSLDDAKIYAYDDKRELVTREYVDKRTGKADDVTLEQITEDIALYSGTDINLVVHDAWDPQAATTGWQLPADVTFNNGVFTIDSAAQSDAEGRLKFLEGTQASTTDGGVFHLMYWGDADSAHMVVRVDDLQTGRPIEAFRREILDPTINKILFSFYIPAGTQYGAFYRVQPANSASGETLNFQFVDMAQYPPRDTVKIKNIDYIIGHNNRSIDGSGAPAVAPDRELTTRAYVDEYAKVFTVNLLIEDPVDINNFSNSFIDQYQLQDQDVVAIFNQTDPTEDGVYVYDATNSQLVRHESFPVGKNIFGFIFYATDGDHTGQKTYAISNRYHAVIGVDDITYVQVGVTPDQLRTGLTVRLLETVYNVDLNNPPSQIDYTDVQDGDVIGLAAQSNKIENGFYVVDSVNGWQRADSLPAGTQVAGITFIVKEGCLNSDTLWVFTNDDGQDTVGTHELFMTRLSTDGAIETTEEFIINNLDYNNQFIELQYTPVVSHHLFVFLNGQLLSPNGDYESNGKRIIFYNPIEIGDRVTVKYSYIPGGYCIPPKPPSTKFEFDVVVHDAAVDILKLHLVQLKDAGGQITIDWGDGSVDTFGVTLNDIQHQYGDIGTYHVTIEGHSWIQFSDGNPYDLDITVTHWGDNSAWVDFRAMFANMTRLRIETDDNLAPTNQVQMDNMFENAVNFDSDITGWDISNVQSLSYMFAGASSFNQNIGNWNINNGLITSLSHMFYGASNFNGNVYLWDTSNVTNMAGMFKDASAFNVDISGWNTSNVTDMTEMFMNAVNFNQNISGWDVANVTACADFRTGSALICENTPLLPASCTGCYNDFKFTVTSTDPFTLSFSNIQSSGDGDLVIDWGDGTVENLGQSYNTSKSHSYSAAGTYTVKIHGHQRIQFASPDIETTVIHWGDNRGWTSFFRMFANYTNLKIEADDILAPVNPVSMRQMFASCINFNNDISNWDTSNVTDMSEMFSSCYVFNQPLNNWNVSNVTNMNAMFYNAKAFNQPLDNWNPSNVTDMGRMFMSAIAFNQPINTWDVSKVTNMNNMFRGASNFNQDLDQWNTSSLTTMSNMFDNAVSFNGNISTWDVSNVTALYQVFRNCRSFNQDISSWNTSNVTNMHETFRGCKVFNQPLDSWDVSQVTDMYGLFYGCEAFNQPLNSWNVSNVTTMTYMFAYCYVFNQDLNNWDVSNVTDMGGMFRSCYEFNGDVTTWDISSCTNLGSIFYQCRKFNQDVSGWNTSNVTNFNNVFNGCYVFNQNVGNWDVSNGVTAIAMFYDCRVFNQDMPNMNWANCTNMNSMFKNCYEFNGDLSGWQTPVNTDLYQMFENCYVFNNPSVNTWDVSSVTRFQKTFRNCQAFNQPLDNWNTGNGTTMREMFYACSNFNADITNWDVSNVTDMTYMLAGCSNFNQDISGWNVSSVTTFDYMFQGCSAFNQPIGTWDVSSATSMYHMFENCGTFNQSLNSWNVSNVTNMNGMFLRCTNFNQDLNNWDLSNCTDIGAMFYLATNFNGDITTWNTSKITNMNNIFNTARAFNRDISGWDTSSATTMIATFREADSFNQPIGTWVTSNVTNMTEMFYNNDAFNQDISGWDVSNVTACTNFRGGTSVLDCANTPALPSSCTGC